MGLVKAHDQVVGILGPLHRVHHHRGEVHREEGALLRGRGRRHNHQRRVKGRRLMDDAGGAEVTRVGQQRIAESVRPLVGFGVGVGRCAEQGKPHHVAMHRVAVLAVVQQRHAEAGLGEVGPAVGADLEAREIPGRVEVGGALEVAELDLVGRIRRANLDGKLDLQELMSLPPVHLAVELHPPRDRVERRDDRHATLRANRVLEADCRTQRSLLDDPAIARGPDRARLLEVVDIRVPRVVGVWTVVEEHEAVPLAALRDRFAPKLLVAQAHQRPPAGEGGDEEGILKDESVPLLANRRRLVPRLRGGGHRPAHRRGAHDPERAPLAADLRRGEAPRQLDQFLACVGKRVYHRERGRVPGCGRQQGL